MKAKLILILTTIISIPSHALGTQASQTTIEGDYSEVLILHSKLCQNQITVTEDKDSPMTDLTVGNIVGFISNPDSYATEYRRQLDEYFISVSGGAQALVNQASKMTSQHYEVQSKIDEMLRWNARNHMVALQYEFCANSLALQIVIDQQGCETDFDKSINFAAVNEFCKDPYQY